MLRDATTIPRIALLAGLVATAALTADARAQAENGREKPAPQKPAIKQPARKQPATGQKRARKELPDVSGKRPRIEKPTEGTRGPFHDLKQAMALLSKARVDKARTLLLEVTRAIPEHAEAWHLLATCHELKDDRARARACGKRALELMPEHARAALLLARLLVREDPIAATDFARRAASAAGKDIVVKRSAARILMETGNLDEAKKLVDALTKLVPGSQRLLYLRAELGLAMHDMATAKKCYKMLGLMRRHDPIPFENLARILEDEGDLKGAIQAVESAIRARRSKRELHHLRIRLLSESGASQEAIKQARIELDRALAEAEPDAGQQDAAKPSPKR